MEEDDAQGLADRIRAQEWRQGSKLPRRHDLFLANPAAPVTAEAAEWAAEQVDSAGHGVVHAERADEPPMIIVSQDCDLVAHPGLEPMVEAIPVVEFGPDVALPQNNSARHFTIDAERRLVADQTRRLLFEKSLLPDREAEHYFESGDLAESFRAWCARRYSRVPLADDFNLVVGRALDWAWSKSERSVSDAAKAMYSWRVIQAEDGGGVDVAFLVPFNEQVAEQGAVQDLVDLVVDDARKRLDRVREQAEERVGDEIEIRSFTISGATAAPSADVSLRALLDFPPLALEHFTFKGDQVLGSPPQAEHLP